MGSGQSQQGAKSNNRDSGGTERSFHRQDMVCQEPLILPKSRDISIRFFRLKPELTVTPHNDCVMEYRSLRSIPERAGRKKKCYKSLVGVFIIKCSYLH